MLKTFIRFTAVDYCLETNEECIVIAEEEYCEDYFDTILPAKEEDVIAFIIDKAEYNLYVDAIHLKAALTSCGIVEELSIATIEDSTLQYFVTCTLPTGTVNGSYEITIYKDYQLEIISFTPETSPSACDATFTVEVISPPAINFEYSLDQVTWNSTGVFTGLCMQEYTVFVREEGTEDCIEGQLTFDASPITCGTYQGYTLQEIIDAGLFLNQLYECTLNEIKP